METGIQDFWVWGGAIVLLFILVVYLVGVLTAIIDEAFIDTYKAKMSHLPPSLRRALAAEYRRSIFRLTPDKLGTFWIAFDRVVSLKQWQGKVSDIASRPSAFHRGQMALTASITLSCGEETRSFLLHDYTRYGLSVGTSVQVFFFTTCLKLFPSEASAADEMNVNIIEYLFPLDAKPA